MTTLMIQTFLLLATAFFAGATLACLLRRLIFGRATPVSPMPASAPASDAAASASATSEGGPERFAKALAGSGSPTTGSSTAGSSYSPVVVGVAAAAAVAARQASASASSAATASATNEPAKVVEPAPQRIVFPAAGTTGGSNMVSAEIKMAPPATAAVQATPPTGGLPADELTRIRGIDAEIRKRLATLGVTRFAQIAEWNASAVKSFSHLLGFQGRIERENWIEQAQILAKGLQTHYSELHDRGEVATAMPPGDQGKPVDLTAAAAAAQAASRAGGPVGASGLPDQLVRIHGIDGESERMLNQWGITRFAQIAAWGAPEVERFESLLGRPGRIARENWVAQAQILAKGGAPQLAAAAVRESVSQVISEAQQRAGRSDVANLRSVRSEALRSEADRFGDYPGVVDDLKRIRGIGVLIEKKLNSLGVATYEQVANWTSSDIDRISQMLDFKGRIERENWVEQARILSSGGQTEFSRRLERSEA